MLFRQLEYWLAVSREQHFTRAADVSQPAPSEAIRKLEAEPDLPLVVRGRKFEGLTPEDEHIARWARCIIADQTSLPQEAARFELDGGITYLDDAVRRRCNPFPLYREEYLLLVDDSGTALHTIVVTWRKASSLPLRSPPPAMQRRCIIDDHLTDAGVSARFPEIRANALTIGTTKCQCLRKLQNSQ